MAPLGLQTLPSTALEQWLLVFHLPEREQVGRYGRPNFRANMQCIHPHCSMLLFSNQIADELNEFFSREECKY